MNVSAFNEAGHFVSLRLALFGDHGGGVNHDVVWDYRRNTIFFGLLHIYPGVPGMVGTGVVTIIFGSIYLLGKRQLLPVIIGHGMINTISLTAYYLSDGKIT